MISVKSTLLPASRSMYVEGEHELCGTARVCVAWCVAYMKIVLEVVCVCVTCASLLSIQLLRPQIVARVC